MGDFLYVTRCVRVLTAYSRGSSLELRGYSPESDGGREYSRALRGEHARAHAVACFLAKRDVFSARAHALAHTPERASDLYRTSRAHARMD